MSDDEWNLAGRAATIIGIPRGRLMRTLVLEQCQLITTPAAVPTVDLGERDAFDELEKRR